MREIKCPEDVKSRSIFEIEAAIGFEFDKSAKNLFTAPQVGKIGLLMMDAEHKALEAVYFRREEYTDAEREEILKQARAWRELAERLRGKS